jgi:hypothetical protein
MSHPKVRADFNGLFGDILCLSHEDTCLDEKSAVFHLSAGLELTAYDEDLDENGNRDDLLAHGVVEPAPDWLQSHGSKWVLRIDGNGVLNESDMRELNKSEHA